MAFVLFCLDVPVRFDRALAEEDGGWGDEPVSAPLSLDFIKPKDWRVAKTASRF